MNSNKLCNTDIKSKFKPNMKSSQLSSQRYCYRNTKYRNQCNKILKYEMNISYWNKKNYITVDIL